VPTDFTFPLLSDVVSTPVPLPPVSPAADGVGWSYDEAFVRNRGLISPEEQQRLRNCRVAVAGLGGVGGVDCVTLARLGVERFTIADPDVFDITNVNRQYGAGRSTLGRPKVDVLAEVVHDINPNSDVRVLRKHIDASNTEDFLDEADVLVDGLDGSVSAQFGSSSILMG
jgi:tRNA A37 threonylcarbamoyladenosine dehydratase